MRNPVLPFITAILLLSAVFARPAQALYGAVTDETPEALCLLTLFKADGSPKAFCTATLISATELATAGHCLRHLIPDPALRIDLKCGYTGFSPAEAKLAQTEKSTPLYVAGPRFLETLTVNEAFVDPRFDDGNSFDLGILTLRTPSRLHPLPVADIARVRDFLKADSSHELSDCRIAGFGLNKNDVAGIPGTSATSRIYLNEEGALARSWAIENLPKDDQDRLLEMAPDPQFVREISRYLIDRDYMPSTTDVGDSGGPLYCRENGDWRLAGVHIGFNLQMGRPLPIYYDLNWSLFDRTTITQKVR